MIIYAIHGKLLARNWGPILSVKLLLGEMNAQNED